MSSKHSDNSFTASIMEEDGEDLKVVTEETALKLLHAKCQDKVRVNLKATVRCLSEIFRIKQTQIFLIQLVPGLTIFVKRGEFLKWHDKVFPQKSYIFTNLQATTLEKGCKGHHRVYTVTKMSKLLDEADVDDAEILDVKDWLHYCGIDEGSVVWPDDVENDDETDTDSKLVSYQGLVTKVLDETLGVYELDNRVRLYVSSVPAVHKYGFMQEGLSLTLYNVHCKISKEVPKIRLYCCMSSVVKADIETAGSRKRNEFPDAQLQKLLYLQGVTMPQLDWLHSLRCSLFQNLKTACGQRDMEKIFSTLLSAPKLPWRQEPSEYRNVLDEFLSTSHACCLSTDSQSGSEAMPSHRTVSQLKHAVEMEEKSSSGDYWQFEKKEFRNQQVLIGVLETNSETGRSRLYDSSGNLDAVIAGCHGDDLSHLTCHDNCCCDTRQIGDSFSCPYLHTCCIGKIMAVYRYTVAMETFVTNGNQQPGVATTSSACTKNYTVLYVEFSMSDSIILGDSIKRNKSIEIKTKTKISRLSENKTHCGVKASNVDREKLTVMKEIKQSVKVGIDDTIISTLRSPNCIRNEILQVKTSAGNMETDILRGHSTFHRHVRVDGGSYFCRKKDCLEQPKDDEKCVPVLSVKPVYQKRKSSREDGETKCKVLCVCKNKKSNEIHVESCREGLKDKSHTDCRKSRGAFEEIKKSDAQMDVELSKSDLPPAGVKQLKPQANIAWSENRCTVKINRRESLVFETCTEDGMSVMFSVHAQIWKNGRFEPEIVIIFKGKAVKWYPLLLPNNLYQFSVHEEFIPLFRSGLPNSKVEKVIEKSKTKKCVLVHQEVLIDKAFDGSLDSVEVIMQLASISEIMEGSAGIPSKFVSFKGQVISRSHSDPEPLKSRMQKNVQQFSSFKEWSRFQISTPENRCIRLQVRGLASSAETTVPVFMNLENTVYLLGLLPGAVAVFTNFERKVSRMGNVYVRFVAISSVHLIATSSIGLINKNRPRTDTENSTEEGDKVIAKQKLVDLWQSRTAYTEFECVCDILQIIKVSLKCTCDLCGSTVVNSECQSAGCHMENGSKFIARASFIVDDGTSVAMVTQTGSMVRRLLGLSHDQWVCLEEETRQHGEVFVQQNRPVHGSELEKFAYMLCDNRMVKKTWQMTFRTKQYGQFGCKTGMDLDSLSLDDFALKSVDTGTARVSTRCLPFLQLECTGLKEVDAAAWALHFLSLQ